MYKKKFKKSAVVAGIILSVALLMSGCSNKSGMASVKHATNSMDPMTMGSYDGAYGGEEYYEDYRDYEYDYAYEEGAVMAAAEPQSYIDNGGLNESNIVDNGSASSSVGNNEKRKLIRTVDLQVETKEYDNLRAGIEEQIKALGGYVENEYSYNGSAYHDDYYQNYGRTDRRYTNMTIRIPDANLDSFVTVMSGMSNVVSKTSTATDVSLQYTDLESKRDMYRAEQDSLMMLLEKAETIEDITYLTSRLTDVRYNIESMERQLRLYDNQVDYATVNLNVTEVEVLTPQVIEQKTPAEEVREGFKASLDDVVNSIKRFGMNTVINLPYIIRTLVIMGIILGAAYGVVRIIIAIIKSNIKKSRKKKAAKLAAKEAAEKTAKEAPAEGTAKATETANADASADNTNKKA